MIIVKGEGMNNRGFTLVEVVAIIVILLGIFLVSFPTLNNMLNTDERKKYDNMEIDLCTAGKTYMYSHMDDFPTLSVVGSVIKIKINLLIQYGNVSKNLVNPKSNLSVKNDTLEYTVLDDFTLDCKYIEE